MLAQIPYFRSLVFLYMNRHGYNGLCRYNKSGGYNVPFGKYKRPYFPEAELHHFAEKRRKRYLSVMATDKRLLMQNQAM